MDDMDDFYEHVEWVEEVLLGSDRLPKRYLRDVSNPIENSSEVDFQARYRFSKHCVITVILPLIEQDLRSDCNRGLPIEPLLQLLVCLRFYASGSFQKVHDDVKGLSQSSVSRILKRVSFLLAKQTVNFVKFPETDVEQRKNMERFYNIRGFPSVTGCVDGTHIPIANPGGANGEVFRNRKRYFSLNVQIVSGPQLEILDIVVRHPGSTEDLLLIFDRSSVRVLFEQHRLLGLLLGDNGYECRNYLLTPVPEPSNSKEVSYNTSHFATRNVVQKLFNVWKKRFPCLQRVLSTKLETSVAIICATAVLHNIAIKENDEIVEQETVDDSDILPQVGHSNIPDNNLAFRNEFIIKHF